VIRRSPVHNNTLDMNQIVFVNQRDIAAREIYPGVRKRTLWHGANGAKAQILEIDAGATFLKLDVHHPGPEEIYVVSGTFNDGARDYPAGSFVHNPAGSSHLPQSRDGCVLFVFFPEG
jgi:anti-sigma factor ChrR (cupin superfamily)